MLVPLVGWFAERALFSAAFLRMLAGRLTVAPDTTVHSNDGDEATSIRILFAGVLRDLAVLYGPIEKAAGRVSVPSLVVWGSGDPLFPVEQGQRTADLLRARFEVLDSVGHLPPAEAPDLAAAGPAHVLGEPRVASMGAHTPKRHIGGQLRARLSGPLAPWSRWVR